MSDKRYLTRGSKGSPRVVRPSSLSLSLVAIAPRFVSSVCGQILESRIPSAIFPLEECSFCFVKQRKIGEQIICAFILSFFLDKKLWLPVLQLPG
jgi:hypothetical protein